MLVIRYQISSGEVCGGGFVFVEGGSQKGGFGRTPRTPPGYGPDIYYKCLTLPTTIKLGNLC